MMLRPSPYNTATLIYGAVDQGGERGVIKVVCGNVTPSGKGSGSGEKEKVKD